MSTTLSSLANIASSFPMIHKQEDRPCRSNVSVEVITPSAHRKTHSKSFGVCTTTIDEPRPFQVVEPSSSRCPACFVMFETRIQLKCVVVQTRCCNSRLCATCAKLVFAGNISNIFSPRTFLYLLLLCPCVRFRCLSLLL